MEDRQTLQEGFVRDVLPLVMRLGRKRWKDWRDESTRQDLIAEATALAWHAWQRLEERGKLSADLAPAVSVFSVRQAACGRKVAGNSRTSTVLEPLARWRHTIHVQALGQRPEETEDDSVRDAWQDRRGCEPWQMAVIHLDWTRFFDSLTARERDLVDELLAGTEQRKIARRMRLSPTRISQLKARILAAWRAFQGD